MRNFRLPRKIKKSLRGKLWLYPADGKGNSLMAFPTRNQEDYTAIKQGIVRNRLKSNKASRKAFREKIDKETYVSDKELKRYVDGIIRQDLRNSSYNTLIGAKNNSKAIIAYYNFVNAYQLFESGEESFGNICCLAIDHAEQLLKKQRKEKMKK